MGYAKLSGALVQLGLVPVMALNWGLATYGQWLMIATVPLFIGASDFGFSTAASNRIIGEVAREDHPAALATFQTAFAMILLLSVLFGLAGFTIIALLPSEALSASGGMPGDKARWVLAVIVLYGLVALQELLFAGVMRAQRRQALAVSTTATTQLIEGIAVIGLVSLGGDPLAAALTYLAVRSAGVLVQIILSRRFAPWLRVGVNRLEAMQLRELLRPSIAAMALPLANAGYLHGTALALGLTAGPAAVPLYTSVRTAARVGRQLAATFAVPLMPEYTAAHAMGDRARLARLGGAVLTLFAVIGPLYGLCLAAFGPYAVEVWTSGAIEPPRVMVALIGLAIAMSIVSGALGDLLLAINRHETFSYVYVAFAALAVALTLLLAPSLGVTGAALAGLPLELAVLVVVLRSLWREVGRPELGLAPILSAIRPLLKRRNRAS